MVKRISLISLLAVCIILLLLDGAGRGQTTNTSTDVKLAKEQIISLIDSGKSVEADKAVDRFIADFPASRDKGASLQQIAGAYQIAGQFDKSIRISDYVLKNWPKEDFAVWAGMSMALSYLGKEDIMAADGITDHIIDDYAANADLPQVLSIIADVYSWHKKCDKAEQLYGITIDKSPNGLWTAKARLGLAAIKVQRLIESNSYSLAENQLNLLVSDFAGHPDLPETLYRIAQRYEWSHKFEEAKNVYQQTVNNSPGGPWAAKAGLGDARANVLSLIMSGDYVGARQALDKLAADFAGNPDLPQTLYWVAERYRWSRRFEEAKCVYQQVIQKYPDSPWADNARSGISSSDVTSAVISQNYDRPEETVDKLVSDFTGNPDLPRAILIAGEQCYRQGLAKKKDGLADEANKHYEKAMKIWNEFIKKLPDSNMAPEMCAWTGDACTELGRYDEAIVYYKNACDSYYRLASAARPDDTFLWHSLFMSGQSYQKLKESGGISESQADPLIIAAYEHLVREFGDCPLAKDTWRQLGHLHAGNNNWPQTARCLQAYLKIVPEERCPTEVFYDLGRAYDEIGDVNSAKRTYSTFIKSVMPDDPQRKEIKARLAKLSEAD
jgi:tetratricopeptide (TPR) repeat protein